MPLPPLRCLLALLLLAPFVWWSAVATGAPVTRAAGAPVRLHSHNADAHDLFGGAVALSRDGRVLAVGADLESSGHARDSEDNSLPGAGAVYVFEKVGRQWREATYLKAPVPTGGAGFGFSVALADDGQTLAIGAPFEPGEGLGAVHVYRRTDGGWVHAAALRAPDGVRRFGEQLALSTGGTSLAVSATQAARAVQAHVFTAREGRWVPAGHLSQATAEHADRVPAPRLAMSGDGRRIALSHSAGAAVQLYEAGPQGWSAPTTLVADGQGDPAAAVQALALSRDGRILAVAGADGQVAVLGDVASTGWTPGARLAVPEAAGALQGLALSDDGHTLVVGAIDRNAEGNADGARSVVHRYQHRGGRWYGPTSLASQHDPGPSGGAALALSADGATLAVGRRFEAAPPPWPWLTAPRPGAGAVLLYSPA